MSPFLALALASAVAPAPEAPKAPSRAAAYYHFSLGQQARLADDSQTAVAELKKASELDPSAGEIRSELALALQSAGRPPEALAAAREGVRLSPQTAASHLVLAELLYEGSRGETEGVLAATKEYEEAAKLQPDPRLYYTLGNIYGRLQQHKEAAAAWERLAQHDPGSYEAYQRLGMHKAALGDNEGASKAFAEAAALRPDSGAPFESLAELYVKDQQYDQAILNYRKSLEIDGSNVRARLGLAESLHGAKRYAEALAEAEGILKTDPKNAFALDLKVRCLRDQRQYDRALEAVAVYKAAAPRATAADYLQVTILEAKKDFAGAATTLEGLLARPRPESEDRTERARQDRVFLVHLGFARSQLDQHDAAATAFERARDVSGEPDANLLGYFIQALIDAQKYDRAQTEAKAARTKYPSDAGLAALEAETYRRKGDVAAGVAIVEKLKAASPKDVDVLVEVAEFYRKAKRFSDAETALRAAKQQAPKEIRVLFALGANLERQKRHEEAEAVFREALAIEPESAPILNYLGYMNADRGVRVAEALALVEKAVALDPESSAYLDSLGWALFQLNRLDEAERTLRRALAKESKNAVMLDHLGDVLKKRGDLPDAVTHWRRALGGDDDDEELDRELVQRKIRDAEASANAKARER